MTDSESSDINAKRTYISYPFDLNAELKAEQTNPFGESADLNAEQTYLLFDLNAEQINPFDCLYDVVCTRSLLVRDSPM
jgi:hypothetical protein